MSTKSNAHTHTHTRLPMNRIRLVPRHRVSAIARSSRTHSPTKRGNSGRDTWKTKLYHQLTVSSGERNKCTLMAAGENAAQIWVCRNGPPPRPLLFRWDAFEVIGKPLLCHLPLPPTHTNLLPLLLLLRRRASHNLRESLSLSSARISPQSTGTMEPFSATGVIKATKKLLVVDELDMSMKNTGARTRRWRTASKQGGVSVPHMRVCHVDGRRPLKGELVTSPENPRATNRGKGKKYCHSC